jgi:hypothetical protein
VGADGKAPDNKPGTGDNSNTEKDLADEELLDDGIPIIFLSISCRNFPVSPEVWVREAPRVKWSRSSGLRFSCFPRQICLSGTSGLLSKIVRTNSALSEQPSVLQFPDPEIDEEAAAALEAQAEEEEERRQEEMRSELYHRLYKHFVHRFLASCPKKALKLVLYRSPDRIVSDVWQVRQNPDAGDTASSGYGGHDICVFSFLCATAVTFSLACRTL